MASDDPAAELAKIREAEQAATPGPWWSDESDQCWRLHGVAFKIPPQLFTDGSVLIPEQVVNKQILKAPKCGTPYAEYWPDEADAAFIVAARTAVPLLLAAVEAVLKLAGELEATPYEYGAPVTAIRVVDTVRGIGRILRAAITAELTGTQPGNDGDDRE